VQTWLVKESTNLANFRSLLTQIRGIKICKIKLEELLLIQQEGEDSAGLRPLNYHHLRRRRFLEH
jgi:hypothetical protein